MYDSPVSHFANVTVPADIIRVYRLIPAPVRSLWKLAGKPTSKAALEQVLAGGGWHAFWINCRGIRYLPQYMFGIGMKGGPGDWDTPRNSIYEPLNWDH
jgi:hypothetical protein